uniref:Mitochondrial carrier protein n=1 Tax=Globisporangium ultimum (strain ATCC 200006 / CBS 805.95 / DAOM BR144) TaxID=431595 RepID=K3WFF5_GLOUD
MTTPSTGMQSVVAGVVAGCVTRSCTSPLDVLKIIIQVNGTSPAFQQHVAVPSVALRAPSTARRASFSRAAAVTAPSAMVRTVRELYSMDGARAFWRGNIAGCCRLGPYAGAKFFLFDTLQTRFLDENPSNVQRAMCGATAGLFATMGTYPLEIVRTRMITQTPKNTPPHMHIRGVAHGIKLILRHEGIRGLYKGGWSGIVGAIPFEGVQFGCYEYLKFTSQQHQWPTFRWPEGKQELDGVDFFVCGSIAGAIAQTVAYPFDTVKKRLQTQVIVDAALHVQTPTAGTKYYRGMCDCFQKVIRDEGLMALYRGTVPNLARIVPYAAVMFSTYEMTKKSLRLLCS